MLERRVGSGEVATTERRVGGVHPASRSPVSVDRELSAARQQRCFFRRAATPTSTRRDPLQLIGDRIVGPVRHRRQVPGPAVGLPITLEDRGQCFVHPATISARRTVIDRGSDQRMPEGNLGVEHEEIADGVACRSVPVHTERRRRTSDDFSVGGGRSRSDEQHELAVSGEAPSPSKKARFQPFADWQVPRQTLLAAKLPGCELAQQLDDRERVPG